jgi:hypothetical protein
MDYYIGEDLTYNTIFYDLDANPRSDITATAVSYDIDGSTIESTTATKVGAVFSHTITAAQNDAAGAYRVTITPSTLVNVTPPSRSYVFQVANRHRPSTDTSGRVLLQPTQSGVTIPTVTAITNGVTLADDAITAAKIAANAIDASALASDAVTEIQTGLATSSAQTTAQTSLTDIQGRLPAALVSGRMDASVGAYQTGLAPLQPTTAGRTLDVSAGGEAGVDWANVGSPTTTLNLSGTTISTSQAVASVSGAVGSVTGNVGGSVASVTNPVTAGSVTDKTGYRLSATGIQDIWDALTSALTTVGSIGKLLVDNVNAAISSIKSKTDQLVFTTANRVDATATLSGTPNVNVAQIDGSTTAAANLSKAALTMKAGTVQAGSTLTAVVTNFSETTTDLFKNSLIKFYSGGALYATGEVTAYNGTTKTLTVSGLPTTPSEADVFIIL